MSVDYSKVKKRVVRYLVEYELKLVDHTKEEILKTLNKKFNREKDIEISNIILESYKLWKQLYMKAEPKPVRNKTFAFRVTQKEKLEINMLLDGRNARDVLLECLRNE